MTCLDISGISSISDDLAKKPDDVLILEDLSSILIKTWNCIDSNGSSLKIGRAPTLNDTASYFQALILVHELERKSTLP